MKMKFFPESFSMFGRASSSDITTKIRSKYVTLLKYLLLIQIVAAFIASAILLSYGSSLVDSYVSPKRTREQVDCIKSMWMLFLISTLVMTLIAFIGVIFEQVCLLFTYVVYCFYVTFGAFFDTVSYNHWFLLIAIPMTLSSLLLMIAFRIERLDPPPPVRKYSIYTASSFA